MRNPFLVGEKIYLRPLEEADAALCYPWFSDPEVRSLLGRHAVPNTEKDSLEFIRGMEARREQGFAIIVRADAKYIGNCSIFELNLIDRNAEIGIAIGDKTAWGKGFGREATSLLCRHGFHALNLHRLTLRVFATNERALKCYARSGFRQEGRLREHAYIEGRYVDVLLLAMLRGELPG
jgi:RimJ/RimL family protein N-acetyltransferase